MRWSLLPYHTHPPEAFTGYINASCLHDDAPKTLDGVFKYSCSGQDHAVQVAGWGESPAGTRFWVARNSWGTYYADNGWMRIKRDGEDGWKLGSEYPCKWATPRLIEAPTWPPPPRPPPSPPPPPPAAGSLKWRFKMGGGAPSGGLPCVGPPHHTDSSAAPSADGETVFVGWEGGSLYAVGAESGKGKWAFKTGGAVRSSPALSPDQGTVFVGSEDGNLYAIDAATSERRWALKTGSSVESSPKLSTDGRTVFVVSDNGNLYAVDAASGAIKWVLKIQCGVFLQCFSPAISVDGATVFFGSSGNSATSGLTVSNLTAVDAENGTKKWSFGPISVILSASPVLSADGSTVFILGGPYSIYTPGGLYAVNANSGTKKWAIDCGTKQWAFDFSSSLASSADGKTVFVGNGDKMHAINAATGEEKWAFDLHGLSSNTWIISSPTLSADGSTLFFGSASSVTDAAHGNLTAIDVTSGAQKWTFMSEELICSSPAISTDELTVFFGGDKGSLYAVHV